MDPSQAIVGRTQTLQAGAAKEQLAQRVKAHQRRGETHKQEWRTFCFDQHGANAPLDPAGYNETELREFLGTVAPIEPSPGYPAEPLRQPAAYSFDCEFIWVHDGLSESRTVCSIGVVDDRHELILYSRIQKPPNTTVVCDSFVRTRGGLNPDWDKGVPISVVQGMLQDFVRSGGVLVGWQLQSDLKAMGFEAAAAEMDSVDDSHPFGRREDLPFDIARVEPTGNAVTVTELTDIFRTANKCKKLQLGEAYRHVFGRELVAHNAGDDALMTMELYNHWWKMQPRPDRIPIALQFYVVNAHSFMPSDQRKEHLWDFLRLVRGERDVLTEQDMQDRNAYKFKFRLEQEREAFLGEVRNRIQGRGLTFGPQQPFEGDYSAGCNIKCGVFKLHLYEENR